MKPSHKAVRAWAKKTLSEEFLSSLGITTFKGVPMTKENIARFVNALSDEELDMLYIGLEAEKH